MALSVPFVFSIPVVVIKGPRNKGYTGTAIDAKPSPHAESGWMVYVLFNILTVEPDWYDYAQIRHWKSGYPLHCCGLPFPYKLQLHIPVYAVDTSDYEIGPDSQDLLSAPPLTPPAPAVSLPDPWRPSASDIQTWFDQNSDQLKEKEFSAQVETLDRITRIFVKLGEDPAMALIRTEHSNQFQAIHISNIKPYSGTITSRTNDAIIAVRGEFVGRYMRRLTAVSKEKVFDGLEFLHFNTSNECAGKVLQRVKVDECALVPDDRDNIKAMRRWMVGERHRYKEWQKQEKSRQRHHPGLHAWRCQPNLVQVRISPESTLRTTEQVSQSSPVHVSTGLSFTEHIAQPNPVHVSTGQLLLSTYPEPEPSSLDPSNDDDDCVSLGSVNDDIGTSLKSPDNTVLTYFLSTYPEPESSSLDPSNNDDDCVSLGLIDNDMGISGRSPDSTVLTCTSDLELEHMKNTVSRMEKEIEEMKKKLGLGNKLLDYGSSVPTTSGWGDIEEHGFTRDDDGVVRM
ncbi:hypothetical protein VKT23_013946 [Stygiomarasmius scandens]|uniref:Uncharacterized protein n=1 Tax=Marasmiellus scandens TaxID=2682957 RepID=A0ABR1J1U4_9AGAR